MVGDLDRGSLVGMTRYGMLSQLAVKYARLACLVPQDALAELDTILCCIDSSSGFKHKLG